MLANYLATRTRPMRYALSHDEIMGRSNWTRLRSRALDLPYLLAVLGVHRPDIRNDPLFSGLSSAVLGGEHAAVAPLADHLTDLVQSDSSLSSHGLTALDRLHLMHAALTQDGADFSTYLTPALDRRNERDAFGMYLTRPIPPRTSVNDSAAGLLSHFHRFFTPTLQRDLGEQGGLFQDALRREYLPYDRRDVLGSLPLLDTISNIAAEYRRPELAELAGTRDAAGRTARANVSALQSYLSYRPTRVGGI